MFEIKVYITCTTTHCVIEDVDLVIVHQNYISQVGMNKSGNVFHDSETKLQLT